jgi:hypothetical protein
MSIFVFDPDGCRYQAIALKFRLLSIHFKSEPFETGRKMSVMAIWTKPPGAADATAGSGAADSERKS